MINIWIVRLAGITLIVLYMVACFCCFLGVRLQDIVGHNGRTSEQTEATGATEHTSKHMFCCLLQPVTHGILKFLIPHHGSFT